MAHAVFVQRLVTGIAPLALLFCTVLGVLVFIAACALLARVVHRYRETDAKQEQCIASTLPDQVPLKAVVDTAPGINLADLDECRLLWDMPERHPGLDRLRAAIRDEQKKGD